MAEATEKAPAIYRAIAGVIADVGSVGKDKINKQQGFKFRSIDDVYNALHPALAKNKVFIVPDILEQTREIVETKSGTKMTMVICKIRYTFYAEDGSHIECIIIGEALDTGDKATNKAMAIAYKYACFQVFCIPTEEMVDPDAESPEIKVGADKKKQEACKEGKKTDGKPVQQPTNGNAADEKVTQAMINTIRSEQERTGIADELILSVRGVKAKKVEDMTVNEFNIVMKKFQVTASLTKGDTDERH
jgi:hypothetical protein